MKGISYRLIAAALAFGFGLACTDFCRALTPSREELSLAKELAPQSDLYREVLLRGELKRLRGLLHRYAAEHAVGLRPATYPRSLDDLVREGYLSEIPLDPITGEREWQVEQIVCLSSGRAAPMAVIDVHSKSTEISSEGTRYNEW